MDATETQHAPGHGPAAEHAHPGPREYVKVAIFLAIVTAIEVAIYYIPAIRRFLVPLLLTFSTLKFGLVALYFMHLKFDSRLFRRLFVLGIALALSVFGIVLSAFLLSGKVVTVAGGFALAVIVLAAILR